MSEFGEVHAQGAADERARIIKLLTEDETVEAGTQAIYASLYDASGGQTPAQGWTRVVLAAVRNLIEKSGDQ